MSHEEMVQDEMIKWIDSATYEELLRRNRYALAGSPWFQGKLGVYYLRVLRERKAADPDEAVAASKRIGWSTITNEG